MGYLYIHRKTREKGVTFVFPCGLCIRTEIFNICILFLQILLGDDNHVIVWAVSSIPPLMLRFQCVSPGVGDFEMWTTTASNTIATSLDVRKRI
jgi:hypothetical protein